MKVKKAAGFYVGIIAAVLCIVSGILYQTDFVSITYKEQVYDVTVVALLIAAGIISIIMLIIPKVDGFAPVVLCIASGISFLMFIHMMVWPIADTIYGIEPFAYVNEIILVGVLMVVSFLFAEVSLYLKKTKEPKEK